MKLSMLRLGVMVLALLVVGTAYSKEEPSTKTAESKKTPDPEQIGGDKNPLTVKILPAPDAEAKAAQEEQYRHEKASEEEWLTNATIWLAIVTTALAGFTALLWWATYKLALDARDTANRQAEEMRVSLAISKQAAEATQASVALAREEFHVTHRPKIRVRRVILEEELKTANISIRYDIVNIGNRPARILGGIATAVFWNNPAETPLPPLPNPLDNQKYNVMEADIEPGAKHSRIVEVDGDTLTNFQFARWSASSNLYFLGFIKYQDDLGNIRETAFCRRHKLAGFSSVDHPDYEYED